MISRMLRARDLFGFRLGLARLEGVRWVALAGVGAMTLVVYWLGLISPYSLKAVGLRPHVDIASLAHGQPRVQIELSLTYAALLVLYYLAWRICRQPSHADAQRINSDPRLWAVLLATVAAVNLAMLSLYPIGAVDVFDYVAQGREITVWHDNPFYTPADQNSADPVLAYTGWSNLTTLYGPAWQLIGAGLTGLAGQDLRINLLAFKSVAVMFYLGCIAIIAAILHRQAPERALAAVSLFALNPLVIYETAGNGHNDIVMVFWMLLGFYFLSRERHSLAALALTVGALTKFVPGFILPVVLVYSLSRLPTWCRRCRFLVVTGLDCGLLTAAVMGIFWRGGDMLAAQGRLTMLTTSLPAFVEALLEPRWGPALSEQWVGQLSLLLTGAAVVVAARTVWRGAPSATTRQGRPDEAPWLRAARASTAVLLFYLLATCLWFQSWYTLWPLSLAVLLPDGPLATAAILLSVAGIWKPIYFDFFLNRSILPPRVRREALLGPMVLGTNWLFAGLSVARSGWHRWPDKKRAKSMRVQ
jgi:Glycosyltransferase family 87